MNGEVFFISKDLKTQMNCYDYIFINKDIIKQTKIVKNDCLYFNDGNNIYFFLIVKNKYWQDPIYKDIEITLYKLHTLLQLFDVVLDKIILHVNISKINEKIITKLVKKYLKNKCYIK